MVSCLLDQLLVARIDSEPCACVQLTCACLSTSRAACNRVYSKVAFLGQLSLLQGPYPSLNPHPHTIMSMAHVPDFAVDVILASQRLSLDIKSIPTFREEYQEQAKKLEDFNSKLASQGRAVRLDVKSCVQRVVLKFFAKRHLGKNVDNQNDSEFETWVKEHHTASVPLHHLQLLYPGS